MCLLMTKIYLIAGIVGCIIGNCFSYVYGIIDMEIFIYSWIWIPTMAIFGYYIRGFEERKRKKGDIDN